MGQTPSESSDSLETADLSQESEVSANSVNDPHGPRVWRSTMVELSGKNRALNEFSVERVGEKVEQNLVVLHGYGAGLGFFYKNFEALSRASGWQLYALDLLGMGRSTRPSFKIKAKERQHAITEAEDWFVDALEEWRVKRKIEKFTLLGHSLGGYMAVAYALKYPGRLNKLILASPVGVPEDPYAVSAEMPEPSESTMANEFTQDQSTVTESRSGQQQTHGSNSNSNNDNNNNANTPKATSKAPGKEQSVNKTNNNGQPPRRSLPWWLTYLWDSNVSPFSFVRWTGPFGPRLVSGWTARRFSHLPQPEAQVLHDYAYSLFRLRGSGEYVLAYILAPGAFARSPLIRRIHGVGRQFLSEPATFQSTTQDTPTAQNTALSVSNGSQEAASSSTSSFSTAASQPRRENGIPVVFMYGEQDWMSESGGRAAQAKIEEERKRILKDASPEEREADRGSAKVVVIKKAGHHVYLDGFEEFNKVMLEEMKGVFDPSKQ